MANLEPSMDDSGSEQDDAPDALRQQSAEDTNRLPETDSIPKEDKVSFLSLPHKGQLALLCIARLADPLARTSIQSYMFYQLKFFDPSASSAKISTQAGVLLGSQTAAAVCTGMLWGRLADSELGGRKLVLMIGLISSCITYVGYGLSRSFPIAVAWQVFGGAMSSNVGITRCVAAELNPEKRNRTRALLLLPVFANAGMLFGPLAGGILSPNPREAPTSEYPYLPPNLFAAAIYAVTAVGVFFHLQETLESLQDVDETELQRLWRRFKEYFAKDGKMRYAYKPVDTEEPVTPTSPVVDPSPTSPPPHSGPLISKPIRRKEKLPFHRMWTSNVVCTMVAHFIISGHLGTFSSLWAIFLSTPVGDLDERHPPLKFNGGLGMLPRDVGIAMSLLGATGVILQLVAYPRLQERFGTIKTWRTSLFAFPLVYVLAPFPSLVASAPSLEARTTLVWLCVAGVLFIFVIGRTGVNPATTLLINDCTPHPSVRGTIHTTATMVGNLSRSIFPFASFAIFGEGTNIGVIGLGFWCLASLAVISCVASHWVEEGSNGKEIVLEGDEEEAEAEESEIGNQEQVRPK